MTAQSNFKDEFHYKNLEKYLSEAIDFIAIGDLQTGAKKLAYAKKSIDRLTSEGYESKLSEELAKIKECEVKIANPQVDKVPERTSRNFVDNRVNNDMSVGNLGSEARLLTSQVKTIQEIFAYNPAHGQYQITSTQIAFAQSFNRSAFLEKCNALKSIPELTKSSNQRYLAEVQKAEGFVEDITASATKANVFAKIDGMIQRMEQYKMNAEMFQKNTITYIETLLKLMPDNKQLKQQKQSIKDAGNLIAQELEAANAKLEAEKIARAKAKEDNRKMAAQAENSLPIAGMTDAVLENEFKRLGQAVVGSSFRIERIIITASGWGVNKDEIGRPIARSMICYAIGRDGDGQCYKQAMTFTQNAEGGKYGRTFYDTGWAYPKSKIDCP